VIAKITRGGSFRGAARYVLDERRGLDRDHQPEIIGGNMAGRTSAELAREFEAVRQQRPDIRKPVEHVALSFARDERPLSNDEMAGLRTSTSSEEAIGRCGTSARASTSGRPPGPRTEWREIEAWSRRRSSSRP
jgi:hypothetical protein